jgi:hypothetical protein
MNIHMTYRATFSQWVAVAYVIDTLNRRLDSLIIHTQPMLADARESAVIHTPANISWDRRLRQSSD